MLDEPSIIERVRSSCDMPRKFLISSPFGHLLSMWHIKLIVTRTNFMTDKPIEVELEGELLALKGGTAPIYVGRPEV